MEVFLKIEIHLKISCQESFKKVVELSQRSSHEFILALYRHKIFWEHPCLSKKMLSTQNMIFQNMIF